MCAARFGTFSFGRLTGSGSLPGRRHFAFSFPVARVGHCLIFRKPAARCIARLAGCAAMFARIAAGEGGRNLPSGTSG